MFRFAVIWYLVLATVAGPAAFCCCKTKGLLASARTALALAQTAPAPALPKCCHTDPMPTPPESDKTPADTPDRRCPCPQREGKPALLNWEQDFGRTVVQSVSPALSAPDGVSTLFALPLALPQAHLLAGDLGLPFLSAQDLLRAHHQLRC